MEDQPKGERGASTDESPRLYQSDDGRVVLYVEGNPDAYLKTNLTADVEQ